MRLIALVITGCAFVVACGRGGAGSVPASDVDTYTDGDTDVDGDTDTDTDADSDSDTDENGDDNYIFSCVPYGQVSGSMMDPTPYLELACDSASIDPVEGRGALVYMDVSEESNAAAVGRIEMSDKLQEVISGVPVVSVAEGEPPEILDVEIGQVESTSDGCEFSLQWPGMSYDYPVYDDYWELGCNVNIWMVVSLTMEVDCSPADGGIGEGDSGIPTAPYRVDSYLIWCVEDEPSYNDDGDGDWYGAGEYCPYYCGFSCPA